MKFNSAMSKFLTNKWVLNIVAFLALFNVIGYAVMGNLNAVVYFIIVAVLVRYFSKNMTIVLGVPLLIVNLLAVRGNVLEGMESGSNGSANGAANGPANGGATNSVTKPTSQNEQDKINNMVNSNTSASTSVINNSAAAVISESPNNPAQDKQGFEPGRRKNRGYDIDYATTIEDAYDELNNILGSDGIQRLTADSQNLMKQQMQLAEAMKGMTPVIQSIAPMVENLKGMMGQMGDGKEGLGSIMDLAKKFSSQSAPAK
jgi:hypothetical protein